MGAHVEDSGIWLGTRSAIFRATELPDMVGEEQVRTVLDMPEKAWEKVHCGNAVCPPMATALVRANLPEWCSRTITTMEELEKAVTA